MQAFNWTHGAFLGATLGSETTAAATGKVGVVRRDPMAMLPFCGYNMGDYFGHWLDVGRSLSLPAEDLHRSTGSAPDADGNSSGRASARTCACSKWIVERCGGGGKAVRTPIGIVPTIDAIDRTGLEVPDEVMQRLLRVDPAEWVEAVARREDFLKSFGSRLPAALRSEHEALAHRVYDADATRLRTDR